MSTLHNRVYPTGSTTSADPHYLLCDEDSGQFLRDANMFLQNGECHVAVKQKDEEVTIYRAPFEYDSRFSSVVSILEQQLLYGITRMNDVHRVLVVRKMMNEERENNENCIMRFISVVNEQECTKLELLFSNTQYVWIMQNMSKEYFGCTIKYRNDLLTFIALTAMTKFKSTQLLAKNALKDFLANTKYNINMYHLRGSTYGTEYGNLDQLTATQGLLYAIFVDEQEWTSREKKDSDTYHSHYKKVKFGHHIYGAQYPVKYCSGSHLKVLGSDYSYRVRAAVDNFLNTYGNDPYDDVPKNIDDDNSVQ